MTVSTGSVRLGARFAILAAVLAAGGAVAQVQLSPAPQSGVQIEDVAPQKPPVSPFLGSNPPAVQAQGGKSYYQSKQTNPAPAVRCDSFNRIGQGFDECRSRQMNQAWQQQQQQQSGALPNPRMQGVDPLAKTRPYR